jgi:uncharacterized membrane protein HdeD (DUF308 family)
MEGRQMSQPTTRTAGAFDIRTLIGGLIGLYGVILTITGLWFTDAAQKARANGTNLNLLVGIALLIAGAIFIAWALLRPVRIPVDEKGELDESAGEGTPG